MPMCTIYLHNCPLQLKLVYLKVFTRLICSSLSNTKGIFLKRRDSLPLQSFIQGEKWWNLPFLPKVLHFENTIAHSLPKKLNHNFELLYLHIAGMKSLSVSSFPIPGGNWLPSPPIIAFFLDKSSFKTALIIVKVISAWGGRGAVNSCLSFIWMFWIIF